MILLYEEEIVRFIFTYDIRQQVYLVGDFNDWDEKSLPMQPIKWHWILDIYLSQGEYEFKYLAGKLWWNDNEAHKYVPNCWGSENSVVIVQPNYQLKSKGLSC